MSPNTPDPHYEDPPTTRGLRASQKVGGGRFTLVSPLGEGGMGVVWKAVDATLGGMVALKFLPVEISSDPTAIEDLRRETAQSRRLSHPNIVRVYDLYEDISPFIYMEFVEGHTLSHERVRHPRRVLPWSFLAPYAAQLCDALDYAHRERIVHRDLKPGNVLIDPQRDAVKLVDFGIARVMAESVTRITMQKPGEGTIVYMSCQQLNGEPASATDDIYSLGVTLYELLTSKPPFHSGDTAWQIRYGEVAPVSQRLLEFNLDNDVPPHVEEAVMACLARDPFKRPPTAHDAAEMLGLMDSRGSRGRMSTPRRNLHPASGASSPRSPRLPVPTEDTLEEQVDPEAPHPQAVPTPRPSPHRPATGRRTPRSDPQTAPAGDTSVGPARSIRGLVSLLLGAVLLTFIGLGVYRMIKTAPQQLGATPTNASPPNAEGSSKKRDDGGQGAPSEPGLGTATKQGARTGETAPGESGPSTQPKSEERQPREDKKTINEPVVVVVPSNQPPLVTAAPATSPVTTNAPALAEKPRLTSPQARPFPEPGKPWTNSLGMQFVPLSGTEALLVSAWETRVQDYEAFAREVGGLAGTKWRPAPGSDLTLHPVVNVNWSNAVEFCRWLTRTERETGALDTNQSYRLPTDREWSLAAGITDEGKGSPRELSERKKTERNFGWGTAWPPPPKAANLKGKEALEKDPNATCIPGYADGVSATAPVGSYPAGRTNGLFDLTGNASEWCHDAYQMTDAQRVVRGGSWDTYVIAEARLRDRQYENAGTAKPTIGFRCVLDAGLGGK